jgi:uncharacterized protein
MQISRFVVGYDDVRPNEHVLYSVLHDRYVGIDAEIRSAIARWVSGEPAQGEDEREVRAALLDQGFLVEDRTQDDSNLRAHLAKAAEGMPGTLMVTLMPTLACNLACDYCFQKDSPAFTKMRAPTEQATLDWLLRTVDERGLRALHVHYFGGEPLTRKDYVLRTAKALSSAMAARGGTFEWTMTSNGVLLDVEFAKAISQFGSGSIKITFDGDKETHDKARVYRDGRGSFDVIFANVVACAPFVKIWVGGNFRPGEAESYEKLLARLEAAGLSGKLEGVRFKPVVEVGKTSSSTCTSCADNKASDLPTLVQLNRSIDKRKLGLKKHSGETLESMIGPCELHWTNNFTIDPEGFVYKCPAVAGRSEMAVTNVASSDPQKPAPLLVPRPWEKCGDCAFMPVCMGGCLGGKWLQTGRTDEVFCLKDQFEVSFRETVGRRYLDEFGGHPAQQTFEHAA